MSDHKKSSFLAYFAVSVFAVALGAGSARAANEPQLTRAEALQLQDQFQKATVAADAAALDKLMAAECIFIHGNAMMQTKSEFMGMLKSGRMKVSEFKGSSQKVIPFHGGAIVTSVADWGMAPPHGAMGAHPMVLHMRISDVWVHTAQGWQLMLEQDTTLPQRGGMRAGGGRMGRRPAPKQ